MIHLGKIELTGIENKINVDSDILIIQVKWGGLGDHLFFSHIPRIAKAFGSYKKVFISNHSEYKSPLYKALVWDIHPYIDGYTDLPGWYPEIVDTFPETNYLDMIMFGYGLDDGLRWHEPEFYFIPILRNDLKDLIIYDPNFITNNGQISSKHLNNYFIRLAKKPDLQLRPRNNSLLLKDVPFVESESLEDYCSIIASCKKFYCLTSGGATLASALGVQASVFFGPRVKRKFHHSKLHEYIFIKSENKSFVKRIYNKLRYEFNKISIDV